jgi:preprotein translocase subunit YajC
MFAIYIIIIIVILLLFFYFTYSSNDEDEEEDYTELVKTDLKKAREVIKNDLKIFDIYQKS